MKKSSLITSLVLASLVFMGCSKKVSEPTTVEIWHTYNGSQQEYLVNAAEQFNNSQSKYVVKVLAQDY